MAMDLTILIVVLIFGILGYLKGIVKQALDLVAIVLAYLLSAPVAQKITQDFVSKRQDSPDLVQEAQSLAPTVVYVTSRLITGLVVYIILRIVFRFLNRRLGFDQQGGMKPWNKKWGALLGGVKGLIAMFIFLCIVDGWPQAFAGKRPDLHAGLKESHAEWFVSELNPVRRFGIAERTRLLRLALKDPEAWEAAQDDPTVRPILEHPSVKQLMEDPEFVEAAQNRDLKAIFKNPNFKALFKDEELMTLLRQVDIEAVTRKMTELAKQREKEEAEDGEEEPEESEAPPDETADP